MLLNVFCVGFASCGVLVCSLEGNTKGIIVNLIVAIINAMIAINSKGRLWW